MGSVITTIALGFATHSSLPSAAMECCSLQHLEIPLGCCAWRNQMRLW